MSFLKSLYIDRRFFVAAGLVATVLVVSEFIPLLRRFAIYVLVGLGVLFVADIVLLYRRSCGVNAWREMADRFSNGDHNPIRIHIESRYSMPVSIIVIDETPIQFQYRRASYTVELEPGGKTVVRYALRPTKRGEYRFGAINLYVRSLIRFVQRRYRFADDQMVPVYPSYIQMRRYELMAHSHRLTELGIKKVRRVGQTMEFDQIREYVAGDDYRMINWKATARKAGLMVNQYQDERSQRVYSFIDRGRAMRMPFDEMTLLDYAINASLVLSNIAVMKQDRAGLVTFSKTVHDVLPAERTKYQMHRIVERLYNQETTFPESDFERLYINVRHAITTRSLIFLFTNFETWSGLQRQLPYLLRLSRLHLLVVVFFENTEIRELLQSRPGNTEEVAVKTVAEKIAYEKRQIAKELARYGILSIYTAPGNLTANTVNRYLEIKARRLI